MSLVNKLKGIWKGDILELSNTEGSISGYVSAFNATKITLSHQDPVKEEKWGRNQPWRDLSPLRHFKRYFTPKGFRIFSGNRTYELKDFDRYKKLRKTGYDK